MISSLLPPTSFALKFSRIKISNAADMQTTEGQHNDGNSSCQDRSEVLARGYSVAPGKEKKNGRQDPKKSLYTAKKTFCRITYPQNTTPSHASRWRTSRNEFEPSSSCPQIPIATTTCVQFVMRVSRLGPGGQCRIRDLIFGVEDPADEQSPPS